VRKQAPARIITTGAFKREECVLKISCKNKKFEEGREKCRRMGEE
jgi:hypothetical protein